MMRTILPLALAWLILLPWALPGAGPAYAQAARPAGCQELLANGGFETAGEWLLVDTPYPAAIVSDRTHSGGSALSLGIPPGDENVFSHSVGQQSLTLPAAATQITLSLWALSTGAGEGEDRHYVLFQTLPGEIVLIPLYTSLSNQTWESFTFDVTELAGQTVILQLGVYNDGLGATAAMLVDDASIIVCIDDEAAVAQSPTSTPSATATATTAPTPTPAATATPSPRPSLTPTATPTPAPPATRPPATATATPTATSSPTSTGSTGRSTTPSPTALLPTPIPARSSVIDSEAAPILLGALLSSVVVLVVLGFTTRRR